MRLIYAIFQLTSNIYDYRCKIHGFCFSKKKNIALADFMTFGEVYKDALSYCCFLLKFAIFLPNSRLSEIIVDSLTFRLHCNFTLLIKDQISLQKGGLGV